MSLTNRSLHRNHPIFDEPAVIPGLPDDLQQVPNDPDEWRVWRTRVAAYRELMRRQSKKSRDLRNAMKELARRDPVYFMTMFGVVLEPRDVEGGKAEWTPFIPFPFQVQLMRWIEHTMVQNELGRGDGVVEKSREMGVTWQFCVYMVWAWLFQDVFIAGIISRNEEAVDKAGKTDTIFSKIRAQLGLERGIPEHLKLPQWMLPTGFDPKWGGQHNRLRTLTHPTKTNILQGETTTELSGVGGRATMRFNDEAARFDEAGATWGNQQAVSFHRFAVSSADRRSGMWFYNMARRGESAINNPEEPGPSFCRLDYWLHPYHTDEWYHNEMARAEDPVVFAREYGIDYHAGEGDYVYPRAFNIQPGHFPYDPRLGIINVIIDPGVSDPTSVGIIQHDSIENRYRLIDGFENDGTEDADFWASVLCGIPYSDGRYNYHKYPGLLQFMDFLFNLRKPTIFYGDPAGKQKSGDGKRSFYDALAEESEKLTGGAKKIIVRTRTQDRAREHFTRKNATNKILNRMDFNDTPGARYILTALRESRYPEMTKNRVIERLVPVHDEFSHARTAVEFWATNMDDMEKLGARPKAAPVRQTLGGRRL